MMELEIMCYYKLSYSNSLHGLFETYEPTQMGKGGKFIPMYNMKLHNITCHHRAGMNIFKIFSGYFQKE